MICDNALLSAYAREQRHVSAEVIKEVARDLMLGVEEHSTEAGDRAAVTVTKHEPATVSNGNSSAQTETYSKG